MLAGFKPKPKKIAIIFGGDKFDIMVAKVEGTLNRHQERATPFPIFIFSGRWGDKSTLDPFSALFALRLIPRNGQNRLQNFLFVYLLALCLTHFALALCI